MIIDHEAQLSDRQELTVTAASTDSYDLGYEKGDAGTGKQLQVYVNFHEDQVGTLEVAIQESDTADFASPRTVISTGELTGVAAGGSASLTIPPHSGRYIRAFYTLSGTGPSVTLSAQVVLDVQSWKAYKGVTGAE